MASIANGLILSERNQHLPWSCFFQEQYGIQSKQENIFYVHQRIIMCLGYASPQNYIPECLALYHCCKHASRLCQDQYNRVFPCVRT